VSIEIERPSPDMFGKTWRQKEAAPLFRDDARPGKLIERPAHRHQRSDQHRPGRSNLLHFSVEQAT